MTNMAKRRKAMHFISLNTTNLINKLFKSDMACLDYSIEGRDLQEKKITENRAWRKVSRGSEARIAAKLSKFLHFKNTSMLYTL